MITKYTKYIKEDYNYTDFVTKLDIVISSIKKEFYRPIFSVTMCDNEITIHNIVSYLALYIRHNTNKIIIINKKSKFADTIISVDKDDYRLIIDYINDNLILLYLFNLFEIDEFFYKKDMSYIEFIDNFAIKQEDRLIRYLKSKSLPIEIQDKYSYLLNANNFDLI